MEKDPDDRLYECLTKTFAEQAKQIARRLREAADRIESESSPTGNAVVGSANYGEVDCMVAAKRILSTWLNLGPNAGAGVLPRPMTLRSDIWMITDQPKVLLPPVVRKLRGGVDFWCDRQIEITGRDRHRTRPPRQHDQPRIPRNRSPT